jgi:hypothetical protein
MSNELESQKEIRRILRLLETTARIVETSAITDQFSGGEERCARQFNNALNRLIELSAVPTDLFEPLETDATFGDVCFACHQVAAYLREGCADDFDFSHMKKTIGDELKDVREVVRQSVPDFLKDLWGERTQEKSDADTVETVEVTSDEDEDAKSVTSVDQRIAKLEGQMETVVEILQEIRTQQFDQNEEA